MMVFIHRPATISRPGQRSRLTKKYITKSPSDRRASSHRSASSALPGTISPAPSHRPLRRCLDLRCMVPDSLSLLEFPGALLHPPRTVTPAPLDTFSAVRVSLPFQQSVPAPLLSRNNRMKIVYLGHPTGIFLGSILQNVLFPTCIAPRTPCLHSASSSPPRLLPHLCSCLSEISHIGLSLCSFSVWSLSSTPQHINYLFPCLSFLRSSMMNFHRSVPALSHPSLSSMVSRPPPYTIHIQSPSPHPLPFWSPDHGAHLSRVFFCRYAM